MAISWNPIGINFNDANSALSAASSGFSNAGTIFGKMRDAVLAEEKLALEKQWKDREFANIDRAFNESTRQWQEDFNRNEEHYQKDLVEKIRQFDTTHALDSRKQDWVETKGQAEIDNNVEKNRIDWFKARSEDAKNKAQARTEQAKVDMAQLAFDQATEDRNKKKWLENKSAQWELYHRSNNPVDRLQLDNQIDTILHNPSNFDSNEVQWAKAMDASRIFFNRVKSENKEPTQDDYSTMRAIYDAILEGKDPSAVLLESERRKIDQGLKQQETARQALQKGQENLAKLMQADNLQGGTSSQYQSLINDANSILGVTDLDPAGVYQFLKKQFPLTKEFFGSQSRRDWWDKLTNSTTLGIGNTDAVNNLSISYTN